MNTVFILPLFVYKVKEDKVGEWKGKYVFLFVFFPLWAKQRLKGAFEGGPDPAQVHW